jgi:hypothetical protein
MKRYKVLMGYPLEPTAQNGLFVVTSSQDGEDSLNPQPKMG